MRRLLGEAVLTQGARPCDPGGNVANIPRQRESDESARAAPPSPARRCVVIDDHRIFADVLTSSLAASEDLVCVGAAYDVATGLALVDQHRPDLVVMDYHFEGDDLDGVDAAAVIVSRHPTCCVVMLTGHLGSDLVGRAAAAGISSVMPKNGSLDDLVAALRTARRGVLVVHHSLLRDMGQGVEASPGARVSLSRREREVLGLLTVGLDARAIALQLGISLNTCRGYVKTLLSKLGAHSQLEAVASARRLGLTVTDDAG